MKDDKKKSIIKEAITDYKEIMDAADVNAKEKLAKEFPDKFNNLLKDELNDKKEKSSYNKVNENKTNLKENKSVMKKEKKETEKIEESKKTLQKEEFDITELDIKEVDNALDNADDNDEIITLDEIEEEISNMEDLDVELNEIMGLGIKAKIDQLDAGDTQGVESLFNRAFKNILTNPQMGIIAKKARSASPEKKHELLKSYAESGGTLRIDAEGNLVHAGEDVKDKATSFAAKGRKRLGEDDELNEIFGLGLKAKFDQLDPNDVEGVNSLFGRAFKNILTNPQMGVIAKKANATPPKKRYELLKQYFENGDGTLRLDGQGNLVYAGGDVKSKATSFAAKGRKRLGEDDDDMEISSDEIGNGEEEGEGEMEVTDVEDNEEENLGDEAINDLVDVREKLDQIINKLGDDEIELGDEDENGEEESDINLEVIGQEIDEMLVDESPVTDDDVDALLDDEEMDEAHGVDYAKRRNMTGRNNPNPNKLSKMEKDQSPHQFQESQKKFNSLIEENKKITKQLNEAKKFKKSVNSLVEGYKTALGKYRNQLKEMAIFNTNLSHVNNLFVNEELALTQEDKIKIINDFKKIDTIASSQDKYKIFLSEMKESEKTISESIEDKVSTSIQPSSKQKLDEVVEKTAYENNEHIVKMKKLIEYVENRGKKKII